MDLTASASGIFNSLPGLRRSLLLDAAGSEESPRREEADGEKRGRLKKKKEF